MVSMIRPSLILRMDVDERLMNDEFVSGVKRSYSHIAPSLVQSHTPERENRVENVMRFMVKMYRSYWDKNDADSEDLWQGVMPKWLHNMFYKVSNNITASNKVAAEAGKRGTSYAWLELEFGKNALIAVKTGSDSSIPEDGVDMVNRVRDLYAEGVLNEGVACVRIPSRASYETQLSAAEEAARAKAETEAAASVTAVEAEAATAATAATETQAAQAAAEETDAAASEVAAAIEAESVAARQTESEVSDKTENDSSELETSEEAEPESEAEPEPFVEPSLPAFDIDYSLWGIEYSDGTIREFNSESASFVE